MQRFPKAHDGVELRSSSADGRGTSIRRWSRRFPAGGLSSLGANYMTPEHCSDRRSGRTNKPFAVNLFAGGYDGNAFHPAAILKPVAL